MPLLHDSLPTSVSTVTDTPARSLLMFSKAHLPPCPPLSHYLSAFVNSQAPHSPVHVLEEACWLPLAHTSQLTKRPCCKRICCYEISDGRQGNYQETLVFFFPLAVQEKTSTTGGLLMLFLQMRDLLLWHLYMLSRYPL